MSNRYGSDNLRDIMGEVAHVSEELDCVRSARNLEVDSLVNPVVDTHRKVPFVIWKKVKLKVRQNGAN